MHLLDRLERSNKLLIVSLGFALIGVIGFFDFITGYEFAFSVFYVLPISLVTWRTSRLTGVAAALACALVWYAADTASGHTYSHPLTPIWNTLIRLGFFVIITLLLKALHQALGRERALARLDPLTGAFNSRYFYELVQREMDRLQRFQHPFTVAYFDLDNFKSVNDRFGHMAGDAALRAVVSCLQQGIRRTDTIARLGGDEFVMLFPETDHESARVVIPKIQRRLLEAMQQNHWPISFSIGALTCTRAPATADHLLRMADEAMYHVKHRDGNAIRYSLYAGEQIVTGGDTSEPGPVPSSGNETCR